MNSLIKKLIGFGMGNIIVLMLGFISMPLITRIVSPEDMGKFSMFTLMTNLIALILVLGIDQAFIRFFYEEEEECRINLLKKSIKLPLIAISLVSIGFLVFYKNISILIIGTESLLVIVLFIVQCMCTIISRFFITYIRMEQKAKLFSSLQVAGKLIYIISIFILMNFTNNYFVVIGAIVTSNLTVTIIAVFIQRKKIFIKNKKIKTSTKDLLYFGVPLIITMAITWIMQSIDKIFIKGYAGYEELGIYAAAFSIVGLMNVLQGTFTTVWVPIANEKFQKNPKDKEFFSKVTAIITIIMLVAAVGIIVGKDIIGFLLGAKYREAIFIFPFLALMPIMYTISETTVIGISFMKKTKYTIWIAIISAVTNIIGNVILVPILGAKGAAISTGISYIVFFITRTIISKKLYDVDYKMYKILLGVGIVSGLAIYSSFNKFDIVILVSGIMAIVSIGILYKDTIASIYRDVKCSHMNKKEQSKNEEEHVREGIKKN